MSDRIHIFDMMLDAITMEQAVSRIFSWIEDGDDRLRYVVTPNVDHVVKYQQSSALRGAYAQASLVVADGKPIILASRILGKRLPGSVPGSDLVPALLSTAHRIGTIRVYLLGAGPGVGERAAQNIKTSWPWVRVVGTYSPSFGFEGQPRENKHILDQIVQSKPDLLLVGLGAPKQEIWVHDHADSIDARVALCVGATIDFLAGEKTRAPVWMQKVGMEWFYRFLQEPRRMFRRYFVEDMFFFWLLVREILRKRSEDGEDVGKG